MSVTELPVINNPTDVEGPAPDLAGLRSSLVRDIAGEGTLRVSFAAGGETLERGLHRLRDGLLRLAAEVPREGAG